MGECYMDIIYKVIKKVGMAAAADRLIRDITFNGECIEFVCCKSSKYGYFAMAGINKISAHRLSFAISNGRLKKGMHIDHMCKNPRCINNIHLRQVTPRINSIENSISVSAINAVKTHCLNGHPFSKENTWNRLANGKNYTHRVCLICANERVRKNYKNHRVKYLKRMAEVYRQKNPQKDAEPYPTECKLGHRFTIENTKFRVKLGPGTKYKIKRYCRECLRIKGRERQPQRSEARRIKRMLGMSKVV